jgi:predicted O-linked N-acetylglucosamine transferase (SPINDLY family)
MPTIPEALSLALQHHLAGDLPRAEEIYRQILEANPREGNALHLLGMLAHQKGDNSAAVDLIEQAVAILPQVAEFHLNLGGVYLFRTRYSDAVASYRKAIALRPTFAQAHHQLGMALVAQGQIGPARASYQEALRLRPDLAEAHYNLGRILRDQGEFDEAQACFENAVRLQPNSAEILYALAGVYKDQGRLDEAFVYYRKAITAKPDELAYQSTLLFVLHYDPDCEPEAIFAEHLRWASQFGAPPPHRPLHSINRDPGRRIRIGYLSDVFQGVYVGPHIEAVIRAHDRGHFEVFCYANMSHADALTERVMALADRWHFVMGLSDAQVADLIREEQIDLLVDLSAHTDGNRLGVFARKPAPIQVTQFAGMSTTGLATVDYRVTDAYCDPPGRTEKYHTEQLVRLPHARWFYVPPAGVEGSDLPARATGHVTFGSFSFRGKVNDKLIGWWAEILKQLPEARMILITGRGKSGDQRVRSAFESHGISPQRVAFPGVQGRHAYFRLYHAVDICLDTYPGTGSYTTTDALWMGVPVISLAGPTCINRQGATILAQVGLEELATETPAAYVQVAIKLAEDLSRLQVLRAQLRERLTRSPLMDAAGFTQHLEAAYRAMWSRYCRNETVGI